MTPSLPACCHSGRLATATLHQFFCRLRPLQADPVVALEQLLSPQVAQALQLLQAQQAGQARSGQQVREAAAAAVRVQLLLLPERLHVTSHPCRVLAGCRQWSQWWWQTRSLRVHQKVCKRLAQHAAGVHAALERAAHES